jgi:hypothetical protein
MKRVLKEIQTLLIRQILIRVIIYYRVVVKK